MNLLRREFLPLLAAPALGASRRKPNIIVILADDLGYSDTGAFGGKEIPTPNIDGMAREGVRFSNSYVTGPYCSPTRAGFLTGRYQQRFGHKFNAHTSKAFFERGGTEDNLGLPVSETTIADRMRKAGYATGAIGKWHLGALAKFHPLRRGFQEFFGFLGGARQYVPGNAGVGPVEITRNEQPVKWEGYLTDVFAAEAESFIDRHRADPFFLYLAFNAVHTPMEAPADYLQRFVHIANPRRRAYAAMLARLDDAVGAVLGKVKSAGLEKDTLVVFLSDNGGPTNKYAVNGSVNLPLRGSKGDTWEGGIRVPMIARWKGRLPAGRVYEKPVIQLDITATAAALGGAPRQGLDGVNLIPHLTGKSKSDPHKALYWRFGDLMAVRMGDWKLVRTWDNKAPELYHLPSDIGETRNLAEAEAARVSQLMAEWQAWNRQMVPPAWPPPDPAYLR